MRLKQIKLAGFKSFVDPTLVPFPHNLTAIVGPNGCGKSNLIDAVRWVMGESSAKHLRGDSMTDVIFNGSTARKPVGQASIELVFDNSEGKVAGEFAQYNEIAVRRVVTRDAQSNYFLNNTRCRRKDITDLFLGTGLGPRSYAIIEQGMISRLIESKPQELRIFIEEAAGISKYKERRRETENRIKHTRENLERLQDIREELSKQLAHLQRQANAATRYKAFKKEEGELKTQLSVLKWQQLESSIHELNTLIAQLETEVEARISEQRKVDASIEETREAHVELSDAFNEVQGSYYSIGSEIARLEQSIQYQKERKQQLFEEIDSTKHALQHFSEQQQNDQTRLELLSTDLLTLEPELALQNETYEEVQEQLLSMEDAQLEWQQAWDEFNQQASGNHQKLEVEKTRIQHIESHLSRLNVRLQSLEKEREQLKTVPIEDTLVEASNALNLAEQQATSLSENVERLVDGMASLRRERQNKTTSLEEVRRQVQQLQGKKVSLEALQRAAQNQSGEQSRQWLSEHGLAQHHKLFEKIKVDPGWEVATETVLGDTLQAVIVDDFESLNDDFMTLTEGQLQLYKMSSSSQSTEGSLLSKVKAPVDLTPLLQTVAFAEDIATALSVQKQLDRLSFDSVITKDGIWLSKDWIRVARKTEDEVGLVEREAELKKVLDELEETSALLDEKENELSNLNDDIRALEVQWENEQTQLREANKTYSECRAKVGGQQAKLEQVRHRIEKLAKEKVDIQTQMEEDEKAITLSRALVADFVEVMASDTEKKVEMSDIREKRNNDLEQLRQQAQQAKEESHKLALRVESIRTEIVSIRNNHQRIEDQITQLQSKKISLEEQLSKLNEPSDSQDQELEAALQKRSVLEEDLKAAREKVSEADEHLRQLDKQRIETEQSTQTVRSNLEATRMEWQQGKTLQQTYLEALSDQEKAIEVLVEELPEDAEEAAWQQRLEELNTKIQRLGAINLAAIEEHQQCEERKVYLDEQDKDLTQALESLESAIRKIDKETRQRFKETFEQINDGLKDLFPKVFGGGHAYLEMTGDDLLDTGVAVMARPPGKRNSTIHLLSGGEKALTAIALVFSIFQLNPAPFCMLDEVDAPLDDANVGRFCQLVKSMSEKVQFIYISHNKVSMEMADQLAGVTMQEAGVSRLVAVDIEEAAAMAVQ